ncbi:MAG: hypothetical protein Q9214_005412 [Letrouitia sp. 1 TL-2023]
MADPSSFATGVVSLIGLAIQAGVAINKFVVNWKDAPQEVLTFKEELESLENTLQATDRVLEHKSIYERVHESLPNVADTNLALTRCRTKLHVLLDALNIDLLISKGKGWRRIVRALRADRLRESMKTLDRHCSQLNSQVSLITLEVVKINRLESVEIRKELQKWHEEADYQDILCWLSKSNYEDKHRQSLQQHHDGTGEWLFSKEEFMDWRNGVQLSEEGAPVPSTLWLYGDRKMAL